jgi:hypothetical protein
MVGGLWFMACGLWLALYSRGAFSDPNAVEIENLQETEMVAD